MNCPVCREVQLVMTHRENIEIDYCPQCRGVWLDRGELDKLIERSANQNHVWQQAPQAIAQAPIQPMAPPMQMPPMAQRPRQESRYDRDDDDDDRYRGRKKRGGFLGDLFDFD